MTKYHSLSGLDSKYLLPTVLEMGKSKLRYQMIWRLEKAFFLRLRGGSWWEDAVLHASPDVFIQTPTQAGNGVEGDGYAKGTVPRSPHPVPRQIQAHTHTHTHTLHQNIVLQLLSESLSKELVTHLSTALGACSGGSASEKECRTGRWGFVLSGQRCLVEATFCICSTNKQVLSCFCGSGIVLSTVVMR